MGQLVSLLATPHAPGQTSLAELPPEPVKARIAAAWATLKAHMAVARPDLVIGISNDHFQNFHAVTPPFCVGTGDWHRLPDDEFAERLKLSATDWPGAPEEAALLLQTADDTGFPLAFSDRLSFMDEFSLPLHFMGLDRSCRLLPILTNCLHRNRPSPASCLRLGQLVSEFVSRLPAETRVAVLGTGGLSHDPYGPDWGLIDEDFDRQFLDLLAEGDVASLLEQITPQRIDQAGAGGSPEVLNWICALGAAPAGLRGRVLDYMPVMEWSIGAGFVEWPITPATGRADA